MLFVDVILFGTLQLVEVEFSPCLQRKVVLVFLSGPCHPRNHVMCSSQYASVYFISIGNSKDVHTKDEYTLAICSH